jgi:hypothetical protein
MDVVEERGKALLIFGRKMFRRIYGPKYENGEWKSWTNRELEETSKGEDTVKWIKWQRISWLGHLERMEEDRMPKRSSLKNRMGREEGEDTGKDGKRK